jgi:hypothetical protein
LRIGSARQRHGEAFMTLLVILGIIALAFGVFVG